MNQIPFEAFCHASGGLYGRPLEIYGDGKSNVQQLQLGSLPSVQSEFRNGARSASEFNRPVPDTDIRTLLIGPESKPSGDPGDSVVIANRGLVRPTVTSNFIEGLASEVSLASNVGPLLAVNSGPSVAVAGQGEGMEMRCAPGWSLEEARSTAWAFDQPLVLVPPFSTIPRFERREATARGAPLYCLWPMAGEDD